MSIYALGGGEVCGDKFVRYAYLDESGTGNPEQEPFIIVAGFLINVDGQYKDMERYLLEMADDFATQEDRSTFTFHAQSLFTGGKKEFKAKYSLEKRHRFLRHLCEIPEKFNLPVIFHAMDRKKLAASRAQATHNELLTEGLMHSTMTCAQGVQLFMQKHAGQDEVATLVCEQNGEFSKHIRRYHDFIRSRIFCEVRATLKLNNMMPLDRVAETIFFAGKSDGSPLQVADACAYIINRVMRGKSDAERFFAPLKRQFFFGTRSERILD
jgi:Protein of unknown function (DUF3800)